MNDYAADRTNTIISLFYDLNSKFGRHWSSGTFERARNFAIEKDKTDPRLKRLYKKCSAGFKPGKEPIYSEFVDELLRDVLTYAKQVHVQLLRTALHDCMEFDIISNSDEVFRLIGRLDIARDNVRLSVGRIRSGKLLKKMRDKHIAELDKNIVKPKKQL